MTHKKIRIAKLLANYNQGSRREIEKMIIDKKVSLNGKIISSPVTFANISDDIKINKKKINFIKKVRIFKFFKPRGVLCSKKKQDSRKIIYEILSSKFKNYIFAGRLDYNSEGLIILTNSSKITSSLEKPEYNFSRIYEVRVYGEFNLGNLKKISNGVNIKGIKYKPFQFHIKSKIKKNTNLEMTLFEGKKNEIREIFKSLNLQVNKLKRTQHGPFLLKNMKPGDIKEVTANEINLYENYIRNKKG